jgi:hypothetical protein
MSDRRSADLQYLLDRLAIEDCVNRYARAVDRRAAVHQLGERRA